MAIHSSAIIDPTATLGANVEIGPYTIIGPDCHIGEDSKLGAHVVLEAHTTLGSNCQVASGAILGGLPQDHNFGGEVSYATIGNNVIIREGVTINRATGEGKHTRVGDGCMLMANSHLGHNAQLGTGVILANGALLGGYAEVGDYAFISGNCAIHQFVKVGRIAIMSGLSAARQDLPPFSFSEGAPARLAGINTVGLKRRGLNLEQRTNIKRAYKLLWFSGLNTTQAVEAIRTELPEDPNITELVEFVLSSKRGIHKPETKVSAPSEPLVEV